MINHLETPPIMEAPDRRSIHRVALELGKETWIGTVAGSGEAFEYRIVDTSPDGVGFVLSSQDAERVNLQIEATIHLHLPFRCVGELRDLGTVKRVVKRTNETLFGVVLSGRVSVQYPLHLEMPTGANRPALQLEERNPVGLFRRVFKDTYFLKRGLLIYLDHLIPLFARAALVRKRISPIDARRHCSETRWALAESIEVMAEYLALCEAEGFSLVEDATAWNWRRLRNAVTTDFSLEALTNRYRTREVRPYVHSISLLDHRLYSNFNTLVALCRLSQDELDAQ